MDDLSSCSCNGLKSFPRRQDSAACDAVVNAFKSIPSSPTLRKGVVLLLPRSLSRRLRRNEDCSVNFTRTNLCRPTKPPPPEPKPQSQSPEFQQVPEAVEVKVTVTVGESEFSLSSQSSSRNAVVLVKTTSLGKDKVSERVGGEVGEDSASMARPTTPTTTTCSPQNDKVR
ncbi:hypothetical protein DVH24_007947 [Malus domestica]|uniref:Uncharacterized protein n=1 Tax=Malus domestica TaxID=3750 RepID=A0A498JKR9_MALDO|nr:hypothetical protein DVH24_007947 [Malus domestica]